MSDAGNNLGDWPEDVRRTREEDKFPAWVVYLLIALLIAMTLVIIAFLCWSRYRRRMCWAEPSPRNHDVEAVCTSIPDQVVPLTPPVMSYISTRDFEADYERKLENNGALITEEFQSIPNIYYNLPAKEAAKSENIPKNRYSDFLVTCYDHTRVRLSSGSSDFINANYIKDTEGHVRFIATQGPLTNTLQDFWQMVWEQRSTVIVMLCNLKFGGWDLSEQYWPEGINSSQVFGNISVTLKKEQKYADFTIRTLTTYDMSAARRELRTVRQFHFEYWVSRPIDIPQCKLPRNPAAMITFLQRVQQHIQPDTGPPVVHCSAGTAETGLYVGLDLLREQLMTKDKLSISDTLCWMRQQRSHQIMFQSQYVYLYKALLECVLYGETLMAANQLQTRVAPPRVSRRQPTMQEEFESLRKAAEREEREEEDNEEKARTEGLKGENKDKNRYSFIIPYEKNRVVISSRPGMADTCYINASFIDGYHKQKAYIITQDPMQDTVSEFWRMVWEHDVPAVVMLTETGDEPTMCFHYWPTESTESKEMEFDGVVVTYQSISAYGGYTMRTFQLSHKQDPDVCRKLLQFHYHAWPDEGVPDHAKGLIDMMGQLNNKVSQPEQGPITVHCSGGGDRSSVFCALSMSVDQLQDEGNVDVFQTTRWLRDQRQYMVPTIKEYEFIYKALLEYVDTHMTTPDQANSFMH